MRGSDFFQSIPFFAGLDEQQCRQLAESGRHLQVRAGDLIFREGEPGEHLFIVCVGQVKVFCEGAQGVVELARLSAGEFFGELALLDREPRSASVRAQSDCELLALSREALLTVLAGNSELLGNFLAGLTSTVRRNTERFVEARLEQQRISDQMELERHRSLSQMVAGLAHELNTPLGIVQQAASAVNEALASGDPEDLADLARLIESNISRAASLVQSFRNLSVRQVTDQLETVRLPAFVDEALGLYRLRARRSRLQLQVIDELGEDQIWTGNPGYLTQILLNLLENIDRYAYTEGGRVDVGLTHQGSVFQVSVRDYGAGISPEHLGKIFEPFFTTGRERGGTGLGLAIVRNLVSDGMGGEIAVLSKLGEGTEVRFSLPRNRTR